MARASPQSTRIAHHIAQFSSEDCARAHRARDYVIRYYGAKAVDQLLAVVEDSNPVVRYCAVWALGHTADTRAFNAILRLCDDPDERVRYDATIALGILNDDRSLEPLKEMLLLHDESRPAGEGLFRMGLAAIPVLEAVLRTGDSEARWIVTQVLGNLAEKFEDTRIVEMLTACQSDNEATVSENATFWIGELCG